jgi:hypothetical protein
MIANHHRLLLVVVLQRGGHFFEFSIVRARLCDKAGPVYDLL